MGLFAGGLVTLLPAVWGALFLAGIPVFAKARQDPDAAWSMAVLMLGACIPVALLLLAGGAWYWRRARS